MKRETITKVFSTTLSLALVATSASMPVYAAGPMGVAEPAFVAGLSPSPRVGYVASSFAPKGEEKPRLIIISDLHGHMGVQRNIMAMLEQLTSKLSGQTTPIFLEGGWKSHLEEPLRAMQDSKARALLADYLLNKSELAAGQAFSERHPGAKNFTMTGVENQAQYEANRLRFAETYPMRKVILQAIVRQEKTIQKLEADLENSKFDKLKTLRDGYLRGTVSSDKYVRVLVREATHFGIRNGFVTNLKNANHISQGDVEIALTQVHQQVLQAAAESRPVSSYLRPSLPNEERIRKNLALIEGNLDLLKRTMGEQLTPEEVALAYAKLPQLTETAKVLLGSEKIDFDLGMALRKSLEFYPFAFMRDESLATNSLAALAKDPTHPQTGILIAGGFHTGSIADYLRARGISYMVLNPTLDRDLTAEEQLNYVKRVCLEHVTAQEMTADFARGGAAQFTQNPLGLPVSTLPGPLANTGKTPGSDEGNNGFSLAVAPGIASTAEALLAASIAHVTSAVAPAINLTRTAKGFRAADKSTFADRIADHINSILPTIGDDGVVTSITLKVVPDGSLKDENKNSVDALASWKGSQGTISITESAAQSDDLARIITHETTHLVNNVARQNGKAGEVPTVLREIATEAGRAAVQQGVTDGGTSGVSLLTIVPVKIAVDAINANRGRGVSDVALNAAISNVYAASTLTVGKLLEIATNATLAGPDMSNPQVQAAVKLLAQETGASEYLAASELAKVLPSNMNGFNAFSNPEDKKKLEKAEANINDKVANIKETASNA